MPNFHKTFYQTKIIITLVFSIFWNEKILFSQSSVFEKKTEQFDRIEINGPIDVVLVQHNDYNLSIETTKKMYEKIDISVKNKVLSINLKVDFLKLKKNETDKIDIIINVPYLVKITFDGSGDLNTKNTWQQLEQLNIEMNGSGNALLNMNLSDLIFTINGNQDVHLNLECQTAKFNFNGSENIDLMGKCSNATYKINGSGNTKGVNFITNNVFVDLSGNSNLTLFVTKHISGNILGANTVSIFGKPEIKLNHLGLNTVTKY